jgi:FKBP-type peptidyl-prolyl cis-trans isomerase
VPRTKLLLLSVAFLATSILAQTETKPSSMPSKPTIPADVGEVKTTASGLKYTVLKAGAPDGKTPAKTDIVKVHYSGWLTDGKLFDSSVERGQPLEIGLNRLIPGWIEGIQLMTPGSRYKFTIPGELGYGKRGMPPTIPGDATLIFEVELLSFKEGPKPLEVPSFPKIDESKLTKTASGLKYMMITEGTGDSPTVGKRVSAHYSGWLTDGKPFDNSYTRGQPFMWVLGGGVIQGWTEGVQLMKKGGKAIFVIPADLAYGKPGRGQIPPDATLIFQIELMDIN